MTTLKETAIAITMLLGKPAGIEAHGDGFRSTGTEGVSRLWIVTVIDNTLAAPGPRARKLVQRHVAMAVTAREAALLVAVNNTVGEQDEMVVSAVEGSTTMVGGSTSIPKNELQAKVRDLGQATFYGADFPERLDE